jgi:hypothetical protein
MSGARKILAHAMPLTAAALLAVNGGVAQAAQYLGFGATYYSGAEIHSNHSLNATVGGLGYGANACVLDGATGPGFSPVSQSGILWYLNQDLATGIHGWTARSVMSFPGSASAHSCRASW